jgi:hypothetical protein
MAHRIDASAAFTAIKRKKTVDIIETFIVPTPGFRE